MKDKKEVKMPEHRAKARLELIKAMKSLAKDLMMEDLQSKMDIGRPDAVVIQAGVSEVEPEMSKEEAMVADMDMFREKEAALLKDSDSEEESEEMEDESEDEGDLSKLKMLLKQKKSQDSEY